MKVDKKIYDEYMNSSEKSLVISEKSIDFVDLSAIMHLSTIEINIKYL